MSALPRLVRVAIAALGLLLGCDDDLGRARYTWDAGSPPRPRADADEAGSDAQRDIQTDATTEIADGADAGRGGNGSEADGSDVRIDAHSDVIIDGPLTDSASERGSDWGDAGAVRASLSKASSSCWICAETSCPNEIIGCSAIAGTPDGGPDAGLSRSQLCVETLDCFLSTGCEELDTSTCYCGGVTNFPGACQIPSVADGVCKNTLERSLESIDPGVILSSMLSPQRGGGQAMLLTRCLRDNQCRTCFPSVDAGADAKSPVPSEISLR
jgi:hypothetical protein